MTEEKRKKKCVWGGNTEQDPNRQSEIEKKRKPDRLSSVLLTLSQPRLNMEVKKRKKKKFSRDYWKCYV